MKSTKYYWNYFVSHIHILLLHTQNFLRYSDLQEPQIFSFDNHFRQFSWYHAYGSIFQHYFSSKRLSGSALILCHIIFSSGVSCSFITISKGSSVCTFQNNVSFSEQFPQVLGPNSPNPPKCGG